jgi:hypothetical protein
VNEQTNAKLTLSADKNEVLEIMKLREGEASLSLEQGSLVLQIISSSMADLIQHNTKSSWFLRF